jgi:hypothetical protein
MPYNVKRLNRNDFAGITVKSFYFQFAHETERFPGGFTKVQKAGMPKKAVRGRIVLAWKADFSFNKSFLGRNP